MSPLCAIVALTALLGLTAATVGEITCTADDGPSDRPEPNGKFITVNGVASQAECQERCRNVGTCRTYTWFGPGNPDATMRCHLIVNLAPLTYRTIGRYNNAVFSGICVPGCRADDGPSDRVRRSGPVTILNGVASAAECQEMCRNTGTCRTYTWFAPGNPTASLRCHLISDQAPLTYTTVAKYNNAVFSGGCLLHTPVDCVLKWEDEGRCNGNTGKKEQTARIATLPAHGGSACPQPRTRTVDCYAAKGVRCDVTMGTTLEGMSTLNPTKVYITSDVEECAAQCERDGCRGFAFNSSDDRCVVVGGCLDNKPLQRNCINNIRLYSGLCAAKEAVTTAFGRSFYIKQRSSDSYIVSVKPGPSDLETRTMFSKKCDSNEAKWRFAPVIGNYGFIINVATGWYLQSFTKIPTPPKGDKIVVRKEKNLGALWQHEGITGRLLHEGGLNTFAKNDNRNPPEGLTTVLWVPVTRGKYKHKHYFYSLTDVCPAPNAA